MNELKNVEYKGTLVLTTQQIAESYGTNTDVITKNFNRNKERYTEGKHYICLKGEDLKAFKTNGQIDLLPNINTLYLWTKHGAFLHAKSLNTDTAWEVYEKLVDNYFQKPQQTLVDRSQLSPQMQMFYAIADEQAKMELEQKRQAEEISKQGEQIEEIKQNQETISDALTKNSDEEEFRVWCKRQISKIVLLGKFTKGSETKDKYKYAWDESFERLAQKRSCNLKQRVANEKGRALDKGKTKTWIDQNINTLSIICSDKNLKPVYESVLREMVIYYCVKSA